MAYIERTDEEIIAAWERLVERHPEPDKNDSGKSLRECVQELRNGDPVARGALIRDLKKIAEIWNKDSVEIIDNS